MRYDISEPFHRNFPWAKPDAPIKASVAPMGGRLETDQIIGIQSYLYSSLIRNAEFQQVVARQQAIATPKSAKRLASFEVSPRAATAQI